jgi:ABC-type lipoprotein release transport system permease subunit
MLELFLGNNLVKQTYGRLLTLGSILGIASVIVVFSLFDNYYRAVEQLLLGIHPHVTLYKTTFSATDQDRITAVLADLDEQVTASSPAIDTVVNSVVSAVASFPVVCAGEPPSTSCHDFTQASSPPDGKLRGAVGFELAKSRTSQLHLKGIVVRQGTTLTDIRRVMDIRTADDDLERLNLGSAQEMPMACLFERTFFHGASPLDDFIVELPEVGSTQHFFRLLSTINLGLKQGEHPLFLTSLENAQRLLDRPGFYNAIEVQLRSPYVADEVAERLRSALGDSGVTVETWSERDAGAFRLLDVLRWVIFIVISSALIVAALGIVSTLSLVVMENRRKIAILRAMGLRDRNIYGSLILKCWQIAGFALTAGIALGWALSTGLLWLPGFRQGLAKMGIQDPQVLLEPGGVLLLALSTLALFFVVAMIPAREACRIDPVEGLQS